jgi:hypothetical protein
MRTTIFKRLALLVAVAAGPSGAETLRIATWNASLDRAGPGLLVKALDEGEDPQVMAALRVLIALDADVILLTSVDYDRGGVALGLLAEGLTAAGLDYPHQFAFRPNTGMQTGFDIDGNGRLGDARDAQGFGLFSGNAGMAILSKLPLDAEGARDFSAFLWRDLPGSLSADPPELAAVQRLATTGFWDVPVLTESGPLHLLAWHATPRSSTGPRTATAAATTTRRCSGSTSWQALFRCPRLTHRSFCWATATWTRPTATACAPESPGFCPTPPCRTRNRWAGRSGPIRDRRATQAWTQCFTRTWAASGWTMCCLRQG